MLMIFTEVHAMQIAKRYPPSVPSHRTAETVWVMIVILLGLVSFVIVRIFEKVG